MPSCPSKKKVTVVKSSIPAQSYQNLVAVLLRAPIDSMALSNSRFEFHGHGRG